MVDGRLISDVDACGFSFFFFFLVEVESRRRGLFAGNLGIFVRAMSTKCYCLDAEKGGTLVPFRT